MADKKGLIVLGAVLLGTLGFALSRKTQAAPPPPPAPAPEQNIGNLFGVVRSDGTPLSGVSIKLLETGDAITTGANGYFLFQLQSGRSWRMSFSKAGYEDVIADFYVRPENNEVDVNMIKIPTPPPEPVYQLDITLKVEAACDTWVAAEPKGYCSQYSATERQGAAIVTNIGPPGKFTAKLEAWLVWSTGEKHSRFINQEWTADLAQGQAKGFSIYYNVPMTGMALHTEFYIKVYAGGQLVSERTFTRGL